MRVLVTGNQGFIGKNLCQKFKEIEGLEVIGFDREDNFSVIENNIDSIDYVFHLAGINRPENKDEFYKGNTDLTKQIIDLLIAKKLTIPLVMTSSIQANKDNDYGKSKKMAEEYLLKYPQAYIYRLHNVFGKWCRPNYNSVVATFCYNVAHNLELTITDPNYEIELIYIDDIVEEFIKLINGSKPTNIIEGINYIQPIYKVKLGELANQITTFKECLNGIIVPTTGDSFTKKLFSTYISYVELDELIYTPKSNVDDRGSFVELIHTKESGQVSVSTSKPGIIRGNHYHHTKIEKFIVLSGKAKIKYRHTLTNETKEYIVDSKNIQIVTIPVGYTHNIENISDEEMILLIWCNEIFDKEHPDTYFLEVDKK